MLTVSGVTTDDRNWREEREKQGREANARVLYDACSDERNIMDLPRLVFVKKNKKSPGVEPEEKKGDA